MHADGIRLYSIDLSASSRDFVLITVSCLIQNVRASRSAFRKLIVESRKPST